MATPIGRMLNDPSSTEYQKYDDMDPVTAALYAIATGLDLDNLRGIMPELQAYLERPTTEPSDQPDAPPAFRQQLQPPEMLTPSPWQAPMQLTQPPMLAQGQTQGNPSHVGGMHPPWHQPMQAPPQAGVQPPHPFWTRDAHNPEQQPGVGRFAGEEQEAAQQTYGKPNFQTRVGPWQPGGGAPGQREVINPGQSQSAFEMMGQLRQADRNMAARVAARQQQPQAFGLSPTPMVKRRPTGMGVPMGGIPDYYNLLP